MRVYVACFIAGAVLALGVAYVFVRGDLRDLRERAQEYRAEAQRATERVEGLESELSSASGELRELEDTLGEIRAERDRVVRELGASLTELRELEGAIATSAVHGQRAEGLNRDIADIVRGIRERGRELTP